VRLVKALWPLDESPRDPLPVPRVRVWGYLDATGGHPPQPLDFRKWELLCTKEYVVGRSRKSDIRIGHTSPMPYISGQHFRLFHRLGWSSVARRAEQIDRAEQTGEAAPAALGTPEISAEACANGGKHSAGIGEAQQATLRPERLDENNPVATSSSSFGRLDNDFSRPDPQDLGPAKLEAWLEDLSQNGTFVNGVLVGKGSRQRLCHGDSIELVFPAATQLTQQLAVAFPNFTFYSPVPKLKEVAVQAEPIATLPPAV
tara:strand:+ start:487 stop:1260 length:774 start_codon:yes stop_codon:yes gene_type:complete